MNHLTCTVRALALGSIAATLAACAAPPTSFATPDQRALLNFKSCAKPVYPAASLAAKNEGTVTLAFRVEPDGRISDSKVENSSGFAAMDDAAHQAIRKCTFSPAIKDGKAAQVWTTVKYVWTLTEPVNVDGLKKG